jgi:uncharacterized protein
LKNDNSNVMKNALVTGATSGIGYEMSKILAKEGFNLVLVARNAEQLESLAKELSNTYAIKASFIVIDLSNPTAPTEIVAELQTKAEKIDILVNNAGFIEYGAFSDTNLDKELQMIQVNLVSLTHLTKLLLPAMLKQKWGKILNVASIGAYVPGPFNAVYCATKAYVLSFSEAIAEELKGTNVTVTALCPGATKTKFAQKANIEEVKLFQGSVMQAKEVAEIGFLALMDGKRIVVPGFINKFAVFIINFIPRHMVALIAKTMMRK